jgi:hypothetical protein
MTLSSDPLIPLRRFVISGQVTIWDLARRQLKVAGRDLWLADAVLATGLTTGIRVTARGHVADPGERRIVEAISID